MQPCVFLHCWSPDKLHQAREDALGLHHFECNIVLVVPAVEKKESGDHVQRLVIVLLALGQSYY